MSLTDLPIPTVPLAITEVEDYLDNWKKWPIQRLGELFYAFGAFAQRTGTFELSKGGMQDLIGFLTKEKDPRIRIHLAARRAPSTAMALESTPLFTPYLQPCSPTSYGPYHSLAWKPTTVNEVTANRDTTSPIARDTAQLFCGEFCRLPEREIGEIFEATFETLALRVNFFEFDNENDTMERIKELLGSDNQETVLRLNLGLSAPSTGHPFRIRPIITISKTSKTPTPRQADSGDSHFEFSKPCPPLCEDPPTA